MHPFWRLVARFILRGRVPILIVLGVLTVFMWANRGKEKDQAFTKVVPEYDAEYQVYKAFKRDFGEDGNVIIAAIEKDIFQLDFYRDVFQLTEELQALEGVEQVVSITNIVQLLRNDSLERFEVAPVSKNKPETQADLDAIQATIENLPFYKGLIRDKEGTTFVIAITMEQDVLDSGAKIPLFKKIRVLTDSLEKKHNLTVHFAGLPVIRSTISELVNQEVLLFLGLAVMVMAVTLLLFFRSLSNTILPLIVVGVVIVWSLGILGLLGYQMTLVSAVIPALITVIGIPNSVYLITKYHIEYRQTGNKIKSLTRMIEKIGIVTIMTNATTAVGFGVLAFTDIRMLKEFGIVAGLSVVAAFFISLLLIPIFFSFLPPPTKHQTAHLDRKLLKVFVDFLDRMVHEYRWVVYTVTLILTGASIWGLILLKPVSFMTDDVPASADLRSDLSFVENKFKGVMPLEILIDTGKKRGATRRSTLQKVANLQEKLESYPSVSRTLSVVDLTRFLRQVFFDGGEDDYILPDRNEQDFIKLYLGNTKLNTGSLSKTLTDTSLQKIRITGNVQDIGSIEMAKLVDSIQADVNEFFDPEKFDVTITGTTKIFIRGNEYLIQNLLQSLAMAFVVIAFIMGWLFRSVRIVIISLIPNFLPLLMVAGVMGFMGVALKPSTALVFSVAFGIAVDDSIHFLARYRLALRLGDTVSEAITNSFKDTGVSMIYTSVILFFGFVIFTASSFGGTKALGILASSTLAIAMFGNLLLLPALLLTFEPKKSKQKLPEKSPLLPIPDEEEEVGSV